MKARSAVTAAAFVVGAIEHPAMMTDQNMSMTPPPTSPFRRGMTSESTTATKLARNCSVDEIAVRRKGSACPINLTIGGYNQHMSHLV